MPVHSNEPVSAANYPAAEQLLLTIGRAGVLSSRAIAAEELETLLRLLGPPSERQRSGLKRATDLVLVEDGAVHLLAPHGRAIHRRLLCNGARASDTRMSTATLKRELALLRSSLAALTPAQSAALDDPVAWAERIAELTLDPWQRDVLLSMSPRLLLNATRQSGKSTVAALKAAWTVLQGGLAVVVSPSLRQSGFLFRKLARHLVASDAGFRRETLTEVELVSGGLAVSLPGDRPAMLRGLSLRHEGPAVLLVDEASRVRDELWATISPMLAAAPAAQQILLSTPAGASGEFHRAWSSGEDWERLQITADQCPRISAAHLAAERISPRRRSLPAGVFRCLRLGAWKRIRRRGDWRICSAMMLRMSPIGRPQLCMYAWSIASCNELGARFSPSSAEHLPWVIFVHVPDPVGGRVRFEPRT